MSEQPALPILSDGTVTLRAWRVDDPVDTAAARAGRDDLWAHWLGGPDPLAGPADRAGWFAVEADGVVVGAIGVEATGGVGGVGGPDSTDSTEGTLRWGLFAGHRGRGHATRAVRTVVDWALTETGRGGRGLHRVEARVDVANESALRVATRSGLRREGVRRVVAGTGERADAEAYVVLSRLSTDPPLTEPGAFRSLLNSFLPRKRAIAQMLIRDHDDRVLLCRLTYKTDWDLPGGVVEVGESPRVAVAREVTEELALDVPAGPLLLTDWLPAWGGWDDALCLVFDGGTHDASLTDRIVEQAREIRSAEFCTPAQVREHCADFTARRVQAALAALGGDAAGYTESGR